MTSRPVVRFYDRNVPAFPAVSAVMHLPDCPWVRRLPLEPGDRIKMDDGRWEWFHSEARAREVADIHNARRREPDSYVNDSPPCCDWPAGRGL